MKILITTFILTLIYSNSYASSLKFEPVYGVERTQREFPEPAKYRTAAFLGLRALYGTPAFSLEFEVNQSNTTNDFPDQNLKVTYIDQKALLGFRTYPLASQIFGAFLRFGIRAEQNKREIEENGSDRTENDPLSLDPYAGTGLTIVLGKAFALNAGATLIYNKNQEDEDEKFDTRYTFSFTIKAGNK